jgi:hypothetical protein
MPDLPPGEHDLRDLALRFAQAEGYVLTLLRKAATGDRIASTKHALSTLAALRLLDHRAPVVSAYMHEHPMGRPDAVRDLAGSLARRLDTGAQVAADSVRTTFAKVTTDTVDEHTAAAVTAAVDTRGTRWPLGAWAAMNCTTIGRQATSRGVADREGDGGRVTVNVGDCEWCQSHAGDAIVGTDALPPFHPSCSCVVTVA